MQELPVPPLGKSDQEYNLIARLIAKLALDNAREALKPHGREAAAEHISDGIRMLSHVVALAEHPTPTTSAAHHLADRAATPGFAGVADGGDKRKMLSYMRTASNQHQSTEMPSADLARALSGRLRIMRDRVIGKA